VLYSYAEVPFEEDKGVEVVGKYHVTVSKRFVRSYDIHVSGVITIAWETVRERIRVSAKELL
jgi:hypothetical protein